MRSSARRQGPNPINSALRPLSQVRSLAVQLFEGLAQQAAGAHNPVYALLPDVISHLTATPDLPEAHFRDIMARLLRYVTLERQREALAARLVGRVGAETAVKAARGFVYCVAQLRVGVKALGALEERLPQLKHFLLDDEFSATMRVRFLHTPVALPLPSPPPMPCESSAVDGRYEARSRRSARARVQDIIKRLEDANKERPEACDAIKAFVTKLDAARAEVAELSGAVDADADAGGEVTDNGGVSGSGCGSVGGTARARTGKARPRRTAAAREDSSGADEVSDAESSPDARGCGRTQATQDVAGPSRRTSGATSRRGAKAASSAQPDGGASDADDDFARSAPATPARGKQRSVRARGAVSGPTDGASADSDSD